MTTAAPIDLMFTHYSGDTFMSLEKLQADVEHLATGAGGDRAWVTLTEMAKPKAFAAVQEVVGDRYQLLNPDDGDIAFLVHPDLPVLSTKGVEAIPKRPGPASQGGHGPRFVSEFATKVNGVAITALGVHLVRQSPKGAGDQTAEQVAHFLALAQRMSQTGKGRRVAIGSGDLNGTLPNRDDLQRIVDRYHLTSTAQETGVQTPTHGDHRIDYVFTRDADKRVRVTMMAVRRGPRWNTDHDPIDVAIRITP